MSAADWHGRAIDWVDIAWNECGHSLKKKTRAGCPVSVLLPVGQTLAHNDLIYQDEAKAIVIHVLACEVIVAHITDVREMATLALELGNLHLPVQIGNEQIVFIENEAAKSVLEAMKIRWTKEIRRFEPTPVMSSPGIERSPEFRVIIRSREAQQAAPDPRPLLTDEPAAAISQCDPQSRGNHRILEQHPRPAHPST
jgi:urease accessory protein UreE